MREFTLYLDESGNFTNVSGSRNDCILGGFLLETTQKDKKEIEDRYFRYLLNFWNIDKSDWSQINHATELKKNPNLNTKLPDVICKVKDKIEEEGGKFVVFKLRDKKIIFSNDQTYISLLVLGAIDILKDLTNTYNEPIKLEVLAGKKLSENGGNVEDREYSNSINILYETEKAKLGGDIFSKSVIKFDSNNYRNDMRNSRNDKQNSLLVISDYFVNAYNTFNSSIYDNRRNEIQKFFDGRKPYTIGGELESSLLLLQKNDPNGLLYSYVFNQYNEINQQKALNNLLNFSAKEIKGAFDSIIPQVRKIVDSRNFNDSITILNNEIKLLENAEQTYSDFKTNYGAKIKFDIEMFFATVYSHCGNFQKVNEHFKNAENQLKNFNNVIEAIQAKSIYQNRRVLELLYEYNFEDAEKLCKQYEDNYLDILKAADFNLKNQKDDILAKLYGTHVQVAIQNVCGKPENYNYAKELSDKSICYFAEEKDKQRQYQYRAELEYRNGEWQEALDDLCKGFGQSRLDDVLSIDSTQIPFAPFHFTHWALRAVKAGQKSELVSKIKTAYNDKLNKNIPNTADFMHIDKEKLQLTPWGIALFNVYLIGFYQNGNIQKNSLLQLREIKDIAKEQLITFYPCLSAEIVLCMEKTKHSAYRDELKSLISELEDYTNNPNFPPSARNFFAPYLTELEQGNTDVLADLSDRRLY